MPSPYTKGAQDDDDDDHLAIFLLNIQIFQLNVNFRFAIPHSDNKRHLTAAGLQLNDGSISSTHYLTTSPLKSLGPWPDHSKDRWVMGNDQYGSLFFSLDCIGKRGSSTNRNQQNGQPHKYKSKSGERPAAHAQNQVVETDERWRTVWGEYLLAPL